GHDEDHDDHGHDEDHDDHGHDEDHDDHGHDEDHDDHGHDEDHDDHAGHDHEGVDPHAWLDPQNARNWIAVIEAELSEHDPENAAAYASNAKKASAELDSLMASTQSDVDALGDLKYIVFHDAYQYFEKRFGISAVGSISLGHAEDPSPARIAEIRAKVKELNVTCVFSEPQYNAGLVDSVFEGSNISAVGVMDPLGASIAEGSAHYSALIKGMVNSLSVCKK
ncbi:MAG: zinc ABC transporter substrate-binding protein, partial [Pseudomonadota bacterium]